MYENLGNSSFDQTGITHNLASSCNAEYNINTDNLSDDSNDSDFSSDLNSKQQLNTSHEYKTAAVVCWWNVKSAKLCRSYKCVQKRCKLCPSLRLLQIWQKMVDKQRMCKKLKWVKKIRIWTIQKRRIMPSSCSWLRFETTDFKQITEAFTNDIKILIKDLQISDGQIFNSDLSRFSKEIHAGRKIDFLGGKCIERFAQTLNSRTHSYTIMPRLRKEASYYHHYLSFITSSLVNSV